MTQTGASPTSPYLSLPPWPRAPRYEVEATVWAHRPVVGNEYEIVFHAPAVAQTARPGQFVEILFGDNYAPLVRRPFSLYRVDPLSGTCSVLYLARGSFTSGLARKQEGDVVSLLGPLGRPFHWTSDTEIQHILVAGGLGAPPLYFLAAELCRNFAAAANPGPNAAGAVNAGLDAAGENDAGQWTEGARVEEAEAGPNAAGDDGVAADLPAGRSRGPRATELDARHADSRALTASLSGAERSRLVVINAARTESLLVGLTEFGELDIALHVLTDDGSRGVKGMATDLLTALLEAERCTAAGMALYACGPMPMLRSVGEIAIARGIPCQLSIETTMPCGIGLCQGCATAVHDPASPSGHSFALACVDGPVFEARDLVW